MLKNAICFALLASLLFLLAVGAGGRFMPARQLLPDNECSDVTELPADALIPERTLPLAEGPALVTERGSNTRQTREYRDVRGNCFATLRQLCDGTTSAYPLFRETVSEGTEIRLRDPVTGQWGAWHLTEGEYAANTLVLETPEGETIFFCLPLTLIEREFDVLEHQPLLAGKLVVERSPSGFDVSVIGFADAESSFIDFTMLSSPELTLNWDVDNWAKMWDRFTNDGESLFCFTGYYRFTPQDYVPTGENCYYRCAAAFLARATRWDVENSGSAALVTAAILDAAVQMQNALGYFPTAPESRWLSADYGLGHNFYDTRFNTDLLELLLYARTNCGMTLFGPQIDRYMRFYMDFAEAHHTETENGGWLVPDYWPGDGTAEPHTSLNHLLAECQQLYRLEDDCGDPRYGALADKLLQAVEDTAANWVKPDHDLHYCRYADGSYGAQDYPDITYKDLTILHLYLQRYRDRTSPALEYLIREKAQWMDANGIKR